MRSSASDTERTAASGLRMPSRFPGLRLVLLVLLGYWSIPDALAGNEADVRQAALASVAEQRTDSWELAQAIWKAAEPGYQETESAAFLARKAEAAGFRVTQGVADIPTAFTAEFGSGEPVIGILGEFDALPGLSQAAVPEKQLREDENTYGHGCGHHLFGTASLAAATAIAEQIRAGAISGTVRFYGCPAEEGGSAKVFLVQAGLFEDCDAVLHWHPGSRNLAGDRSSLARIAVKFRFLGQAAHAAGAPEQGRSALDAVELTNHAAQLLREHTPDGTRIHHIITAGGGAPNVVPDFSEVYYYIRHPKADILRPLYQRLEKCAQAGALATETELEVRYEGGIREILPNQTLARVMEEHLRQLNKLEYTQEDLQFAARLRESLNDPPPLAEIREVRSVSGAVGAGSTDVGDVSWVVPTSGFSTACWVPGTPGHSWQAVACGGTEIAEKGMHLAAEVLTASMVTLYCRPELLEQATAEHQQRVADTPYTSLMLPGQTPPLDYRKPAKR